MGTQQDRRGVPLGFSTGCLYRHRHLGRMSEAVLGTLRDAGADAVELMLHDTGDLPAFLSLGTLSLAGFRHVSLHSPVRAAADPADFREALEAVAGRSAELGISCVVIHPCDFASGGGFDFGILAGLDLPFALENMDSRKATARFPEELAVAFRDADAATGMRTGFVLDLSHAYEHDASMGLASRLLDAFGDRLAEVHLSGHREGHPAHEPLCSTGQEAIVGAVPAGVPIVMESGLESPAMAEEELTWVSRHLALR